LSQTVYFYQPKLAEDEEIKNVLKELANKHCRYGFKKMFHKIRQSGHRWNHKRVYRVYCENGVRPAQLHISSLPTNDIGTTHLCH
jgi:putative transposase